MFMWRALQPETVLAALAALASSSAREAEHARPGGSASGISYAPEQQPLSEKRWAGSAFG